MPQTWRAARVLALLQQVTQLCAVQRSPPHSPVKIIHGLTLSGTHIHNGDNGSRNSSSVFHCCEKNLFIFRITNKSCLRVSDDKQRCKMNRYSLNKNYAVKDICIQENNWHPIKHYNLYTQNCQKCSSATKLREQNEAQLSFTFTKGNNRASCTTKLIEGNARAQCERPYLELLGSEGKRERQRVRQRETQGGGTGKYTLNILM